MSKTESLDRINSRMRSNAAIALTLHAAVAHIHTPASRSQRQPDLRWAPSPTERSAGAIAIVPAVAKWIVLLAAVAAPWVLLLTS